MNLRNKFKAKQIPVMALAMACGAMAVMTPDWRNELQAAGYGVSTSHSGTVCKGYNTANYESSSSKVGYLPNAVVNLNSRPADVICPLDRATDHADGATANVYVQYPVAPPPGAGSRDGKPKPPPQPVTTSCILYSYTADGASLGSVTGTTDVTGIIALSLGVGTSTATSSYTVVCTLPGGAKARITGITLVEN